MRIEGGQPLSGELRIYPAKNAALPILAAIGGVATSAIGLAAGTLALPAGLILIGGFGTAWIATTFWRAKQARKEALLKRNADLVKALAAAI